MSRLKGSYKIDEPNEIECTMTITMPLKDWKLLKSIIANRPFPGFVLADMVTELVEKADSIFYFEGKSE